MSNIKGDRPEPALLPIGFVYFITDGDAIKIGYSDAPELRLRTLQCASHKPLRIIDTARGTPDDEKRLHKQFGHLRLKGEWFAPAPELVEFIKDFCRLHPAELARRELAAWAPNQPKAVQNAVANLDGWLVAYKAAEDNIDGGVNILACTAAAVERLQAAVSRS